MPRRDVQLQQLGERLRVSSASVPQMSTANANCDCRRLSVAVVPVAIAVDSISRSTSLFRSHSSSMHRSASPRTSSTCSSLDLDDQLLEVEVPQKVGVAEA